DRRAQVLRRPDRARDRGRPRHLRGYGPARVVDRARLALSRARRGGEVTPERWDAIKRVFESVVDLPREERSVALGRACDADPTLRREVEALLEAYSSVPTGFLAAGPLAGDGGVKQEALPALPERFGPCRIERRLGSGGMGTVFLAT